MNPNEIAHGAVAYAIIDTAMGAATEIQIRYHRGARAGRITATANVISKGKRVVHLEARAVDDSGELIATATGSFAITK